MRLRSAGFAAYVLLSLLLVFWLPLHVPMPPSASISYVLGFNNRVALVALLVCLAVGAFALRGVRLETPPASQVQAGPSRRALWTGLLATGALCGVMVLFNWHLWGMDESPYLIGRVRQLLAGRRIYVDFEFIYGPALLYLPAWASRLFGMDAGPAYFLVWTAEWLVSVPMLWALVRGLRFARARADTAFYVVLSLFASSLLNTGETYTPLREVSAPLGMLLVHRLVTGRRPLLAFPAAAGWAALLYLVSPEMSLAFAASATLYLALLLLDPAARWARTAGYAACAAAMLAAFAGEFLVASRAHEFDSARQFGGGAASTPLLLTPTVLYVLLLLFATAAFAAERLLRRRLLDPRMAVAVAGFALLPGALGRADPSHLVLYGMGGIAVALLLASAHSPVVWRRTVLLTLVLCSLPLFLFKLRINGNQLYQSGVHALYPTGRVEAAGVGHWVDGAVVAHLGRGAEEKLLRRVRRGTADPHRVYPDASPVLAAPFGYAVVNDPHTVRPDVSLGYLDGFNDLMSPVQVDRKIAELQDHPEQDLLLPREFDPATACANGPEGGFALLRGQYGYNYLRRQRNVSRTFEPLCDYIGSHYRRIATPAEGQSLYDLWRRQSAKP